MVREAELEDMEKKWKAQNEAIMKRSAASAEAEAGEPVMTGPPPVSDSGSAEPASAESAVKATPPSAEPVKPAQPSESNAVPPKPPAPADKASE